jgi:hypothetical protein
LKPLMVRALRGISSASDGAATAEGKKGQFQSKNNISNFLLHEYIAFKAQRHLFADPE